MVWIMPPNCKHLDNYRRCRVHKAHWLIRWLMPKGRPPCILDEARFCPPQDGELTCPDQSPFPRPRPPAPPAGNTKAA